MYFAKPGSECVFCASRKTEPGKLESWEIPLSFIIPFVMNKCPHCTARFWRLDLRKLAVMLALVGATIAILYFVLGAESRE